MSRKKTICVDFDGVIHSYSTPWTNHWTISDGPVPGALEWLVACITAGLKVQIYSNRSKSWRGRRAMRRWLYKHFFAVAAQDSVPYWMAKIVVYCGGNSLVGNFEVHAGVVWILKRIKVPAFKKPHAHLTIDDRALNFHGNFNDPEVLKNFKPWNRR